MIKSGIVMEIQNGRICLMTNSGEFVNVKCKGEKPEIGQIYSGAQVVHVPVYKFPMLAASIAIMMFFSTMAYAYYTPVASIMVKINPYIELKINRFNRIIKVVPLNKDGTILIASLNLKNKTLGNGLSMIMDEATKEKFINKNDIKGNREINISVTDKKSNKHIDISEFFSYAAKNDVKVTVSPTNENDIRLDNQNSTDGNSNDNGKNNVQTDTQNAGSPVNNDNNTNSKNTQGSKSKTNNTINDTSTVNDNGVKGKTNTQKGSNEQNITKPNATDSNLGKQDKTNSANMSKDNTITNNNSNPNITTKDSSNDADINTDGKINQTNPDSSKSPSEISNQSNAPEVKPTITPTNEAKPTITQTNETSPTETPTNKATHDSTSTETHDSSTDNGN